jgi:polar amino acid transport system substrate-binding protein
MFLLLVSTLLAAPIRVGVEESPPFAYKVNDKWMGLSVEAFEESIADTDMSAEYVEVPFIEFADAFYSEKIDVYIPAVTITNKREQEFDFSFAYYHDELAVSGLEQNSFNTYVWNFITTALPAISWMSIALCIIGGLYWFAEKAQDDGRRTFREFFDSFYWAMTTAATVGYGDEAPKTVLGRSVAMIWMLLGIIFFTYTVTNVSNIKEHTLNVSDLKSISVVRGTTSEAFAETNKISHIVLYNEDEITDKMVVLHDKTILESKGLDPVVLDNTDQYYGFVFPQGSILREPINQGLLKLLESPRWPLVKSFYLEDK